MFSFSQYKFVTKWQIQGEVSSVWNQLANPESWPVWWKGVKRVKLIQPGIDTLGTDAVREYTFRSFLPYSLTFTMKTTRIEFMKSIEGVAFGELEGVGKWELSSESGVTLIRYDWHVKANKKWMRLLSPIARPVFKLNHDVIMNWGQIGLQKSVSRPC
ncbi:MAG: SRPBCC family protein [Gemmataceae bacterium]